MGKTKSLLIAAIIFTAVSVAASVGQAADTVMALERAYRSYQKAVLDKDWDKIVNRVSAETRKEMQSYPKDKRPKGLKFMHQMISFTKISKVDSGKIEGNKGSLKVHVPKKKGSLTGEILLRKESGRWRVHTQKWNEKD